MIQKNYIFNIEIQRPFKYKKWISIFDKKWFLWRAFSIFHYFAFQKLSTMFGWFSSKFLTLSLFLSVTPARCCEDPFLCHDLPLFLRQWFTLARRPIHWVQSIKSFLFWTLYIRHIIIMNSISIKHFIPIQNIAQQVFLLFVVFFSFLVCCLFGHFFCVITVIASKS